MNTYTYFISMNVFEEEGNIKDLKPYTTHCEITLNTPISSIEDILTAQEKLLKDHKIMCIILNFKLLRMTIETPTPNGRVILNYN